MCIRDRKTGVYKLSCNAVSYTHLTINNENLSNSTTAIVQTTENYPTVYTEDKSELYVTSTLKYEKYWNSTSFRARKKTYGFNNHHRQSIVSQESLEQHTSSTSFPVITGRNIEQELFETGEFPAFIIDDDTVPSSCLLYTSRCV